MTSRVEASPDRPGNPVESDAGRRTLLKMAALGVTASAVPSLTSAPAQAQYAGAWDKTFPKSEAVHHRKVSYRNRLGIELVADLYTRSC